MDASVDLPVVGMVGAGQLARMTHQAAIGLGMSLRVLATSRLDPAALVAADVVLGEPTDPVALREFVGGCDAVTYDHENVPAEHLHALAASGVPLRPHPDALVHAQDKLVMRQRLAELDTAQLDTAGLATGSGSVVPPFRAVRDQQDVRTFAAQHGWPVVVKARRGGYDGRGTWLLDAGQVDALLPELLAGPAPLLVEQRVVMRRELAVLLARSPYGQAAVWPVVQTVQRDGICVQVIAPAPGLSTGTAAAGQRLALQIAAELDVVGLLAVELFELPAAAGGGLLVNELAMRPHNCGHWTIEGARTSQFEQHLRAVLDYPLGTTTPTAPVTVMSNVLGAAEPVGPEQSLDERMHHLFARFPDAKVHLYGKAERPGRKIGHVTVLGDDVSDCARRADLGAGWLATGGWADGWVPR